MKSAAKAFAVGFTTIDSQHDLLFSIAEELRQCILGDRNPAVVRDLLDRLSTYVVLHFATEEMLMVQSQYPDLDAHRKEHDHTSAGLLDLEHQFQNGKDSAVDEIVAFIDDWTNGHIAHADQKLATYLSRKKF